MQNGVHNDYMLPINVFACNLWQFEVPTELENTFLGIRRTDNHWEGDNRSQYLSLLIHNCDNYDAALRTCFVTLSALLQLAALLKASHGSPHLISVESGAFPVEMYSLLVGV